jgi:hypothetical protein
MWIWLDFFLLFKATHTFHYGRPNHMLGRSCACFLHFCHCLLMLSVPLGLLVLALLALLPRTGDLYLLPPSGLKLSCLLNISRLTSSFHPHSNGMVERFHLSFFLHNFLAHLKMMLPLPYQTPAFPFRSTFLSACYFPLQLPFLLLSFRQFFLSGLPPNHRPTPPYYGPKKVLRRSPHSFLLQLGCRTGLKVN